MSPLLFCLLLFCFLYSLVSFTLLSPLHFCISYFSVSLTLVSLLPFCLSLLQVRAILLAVDIFSNPLTSRLVRICCHLERLIGLLLFKSIFLKAGYHLTLGTTWWSYALLPGSSSINQLSLRRQNKLQYKLNLCLKEVQVESFQQKWSKHSLLYTVSLSKKHFLFVKLSGNLSSIWQQWC